MQADMHTLFEYLLGKPLEAMLQKQFRCPHGHFYSCEKGSKVLDLSV